MKKEKRISPVSIKVTKEARQMLDFMVDKFERAQGHLIEKMIRRGYEEVNKTESNPTVKRSKPKTYPNNLDEQFSMLWDTKGKKGSKKNAYAKFKALSENVTDEVCETFTQMLVDDILKRQHEIGVKDQHLITYLNKEEWDRD